MLRLQCHLASPDSVLALSTEELAGYILEDMNEEAASRDAGAAGYRIAQRNYLRDVEEAYGSADVADRFSMAWRWITDRGYIAPCPGENEWFRLTAEGRKITSRALIVVPRVPREMNPGRPPNWGSVTTDSGLAKQLWVLWEEAVLTYNGGAYLSTMVMLGSLLEGALLGKALDNPGDARRANAAPKGPNGVRPWRNWGLENFIAVAKECGWIHEARGEFAEVLRLLRDYRNLIHPFAAKDMQYHVDRGAAAIGWQVIIATLNDLGATI